MRGSQSAAVVHVAHHFEDARQQSEAATLGTWLFLITELMFFGGLFTAYVVYRTAYPQAFAHASRHLDLMLGTFNTAVLILSSFTMVLAVHNARAGRSGPLVLFLLLTIGLGLLFLGVKGYEYRSEIVAGLGPGAMFHYAAPDARQLKLFFGIYFAMTGIHGVHVLVGVGILVWLLIQALRGRYGAAYHNPVSCAGLYWHFVDVMWNFLFPLLYLLGRH